MKFTPLTICLILALSATITLGNDLLVPSQYPTIQAAVSAATDGDTVILAPGTYTGTGNRDINVNKFITIRSQDGPQTCIIDCNGSQNDPHYGFNMNKGVLAGITIIRGYSNEFGGAIYFNNRNIVNITNCVLTNNYGLQGGAIYCNQGVFEITNCSLINNSTSNSGGAIYCDGGFLSITNSKISDNSATDGGAIYGETVITIKNCSITGNHAATRGGGIEIWFGSLFVSDSIISGNSTILEGGGILDIMTQESILKNCIISNNSSSLGAGAYFTEQKSFVISDCNFHNNIANDSRGGRSVGGAIYLRVFSDYYPTNPTYQIINTSITDNIVKGDSCFGGGLYIEVPCSSSYQYPNIMLTGCYIARNSFYTPVTGYPSQGGGIFLRYAVVSLYETQILQNSASLGGGIYNEYSKTSMSRCRISGNSAFNGSAIACPKNGEIALESCAITANGRNLGIESPVIYCDGGSKYKIANCTIVNNIPPVLTLSADRSSSIINSIIYWNGKDPNSYWKFPPQPYSNITYSDIQGGYTGAGNIDVDPCFMQTGHLDTNDTPYPADDFWVEGDYRLSPDSLCIDAGGTAFLTDNKDLAGKPRTSGAHLDMGAYEYQNTPPVAEAGPDRTAYSWIDGNAAVPLDGSASYDPDGDKLSYLWKWSIDGNNFDANGISPAIQLPAGTYKITLTVNDGFVDSLPDDVNITVVAPVKGYLWFWPRAINRQFYPKDVMAILKLPAGVTKDQLDPSCKLSLYPGCIEAQSQKIMQWVDSGVPQTSIIATFDCSGMLDALDSNGLVNLSLVGKFTTGQYFFGNDAIRIIKPFQFPKPPSCDK